MESRLVSIIIPFYNTEKSLMDRCISSVLCQTNKDFECLIVDDGSKDEYASFLSEYEEKDARIKVVHKDNGGAGNARNYGVGIAEGAYVFFLDSDDYISPHALKRSLEIALRTDADMVIGGLKHVAPEEQPLFYERENSVISIESREEKVSYIMHLSGIKQQQFILKDGQIGPSACAKLVRKNIARIVPFEDRYWDEDNLWNISFVDKTDKIVVADSLWYAYIINPDSMVRGYAGDRTYEFQFQAKQEYSRIKELWPECIQGVYYHIWDGLLRYCRTDTFNRQNPNSRKERYDKFCNAIEFDEFKETIKNIDFNLEKRFKYRMVKKAIKFLLRMRDKRLSFLILQACIRVIKY